MRDSDAAADTSKALNEALDAARRERETLAQRLAAVDDLIASLAAAAQHEGSGAGRSSGSARKATRKKAGKKTTRKRSSAKKSGGKPRTRKRQETGRTDRVIDIVTTSKAPLSTGEVRSKLSSAEPDVSSKLVSAALSYAQKKGRIKRASDGRWVGA